MSDREREDTRNLWNRVADDWRIQVGDDGDGNRRLNSDPKSGPPCRKTVTRYGIAGISRISSRGPASIRRGPISPRSSSRFIGPYRTTEKPIQRQGLSSRSLRSRE